MIWQFPKNLNTPYDPGIPLLHIQSGEINVYIHLKKNFFLRMFIAAFFIAQTGKI